MSVNLCRVCPVAQINCQHLRAGLEKRVSTPITVRFATGRVEVWDDTPPTIEFKQAACAAKTMPINSPRDCAGCPIRLPNIIPQNAIQVAHHTKQNAAVTRAAEYAPVNGTARAARAASNYVQAAAPVGAAPATSDTSPALDVGAANDLLARARATAARKAQEKRAREQERAAREPQAAYAVPADAKPAMVKLQEWLAGQLNKKQNGGTKDPGPYKPQVLNRDADGVSDIVYAPLGAPVVNGYQEIVDYERCAGWTD